MFHIRLFGLFWSFLSGYIIYILSNPRPDFKVIFWGNISRQKDRFNHLHAFFLGSTWLDKPRVLCWKCNLWKWILYDRVDNPSVDQLPPPKLLGLLTMLGDKLPTFFVSQIYPKSSSKDGDDDSGQIAIFHQTYIDSPEIRGVPFLSYLLGWGRVTSL